jgi:polygalacturonase
MLQAIRFLRATNVQVLGITIRNSPMVHLKFNNCNGGLIKGVTISAPANSPNTDGIHFQTAVSNFEVADCKIGTGIAPPEQRFFFAAAHQRSILSVGS